MTSALRRLVGGLIALSIGCGQPADPPLRFVSTLLPDATLGEPYQAVLALEDARTPIASVEVVAGALPPGLSVEIVLPLDTKEVRLLGTPTASGAAPFTLRLGCYGTNRPGQVIDQPFMLRR